MRVFGAFWHLDMRSVHSINKALLVLLPKTDEAKSVRDYNPISLIHSFGKLFAKVLAGRLAPRLGELVHPYQKAFIKGQSIHDNFRLVQSSAKVLRARRRPSLLLKVDIARTTGKHGTFLSYFIFLGRRGYEILHSSAPWYIPQLTDECTATYIHRLTMIYGPYVHQF
jgi:hypothetical protein